MIRSKQRALAASNSLDARWQMAAPAAWRRGRRLRAAIQRRAAESSAVYYDRIAADYDRLYDDVLSQGENGWVRTRLQKLVRSGDHVLDLGCGTGLGLELLSGVGAKYVGLDISPAMIARAQQKFGNVGSASFGLGDMARLWDHEAHRFDVVISLFGSFSHVLDPEKAVAGIAHACRPGGRILVMAYSRRSLRNLARCLPARSLAPLARRQNYQVRNSGSGCGSAPALAYSARELKALFAGFEDVRVSGLNAVLELDAVKALARVRLRDPAAATRALSIESRILDLAPGLGHMLVLTATKPFKT
jgi:ubiquinone/menaquinone biosynthesis C-methylase UbiE